MLENMSHPKSLPEVRNVLGEPLQLCSGDPLTGYLLAFDGKRMEWRKLRLRKNPDCPSCSR